MFDLIVQYGDEFKVVVCKVLFKEQDIEVWIVFVLFVDVQFNVCFVGEEEGCMFNCIYCGKDYVINVLIFFYVESVEDLVFVDIVLCCMVVEKEVKEQKKLLFVYYVYLIVYGVLYVQGYDYEDVVDVKEMEGIEMQIFCDLGFVDLYVDC